MKEDIDKLVDEIDDVLETNAEEFVKNYVQKGRGIAPVSIDSVRFNYPSSSSSSQIIVRPSWVIDSQPPCSPLPLALYPGLTKKGEPIPSPYFSESSRIFPTRTGSMRNKQWVFQTSDCRTTEIFRSCPIDLTCDRIRVVWLGA